jgi:predicted esterase
MKKAKMFIFLHGYNSTGDEIKILDKPFRKIAAQNSVFLYPDAPFKVNNSNKYCWFQFVFGDDPSLINEEFISQSMQQAMPYLRKFIKQNLEKYKQFTYSDVILIGFSQGAGLSLYASMRLPEPICGAISFSGGIANPNNEISKPNMKKSPLLLIHGVDDQILPYQFSIRSEKMLKKANFNVNCHILKNTKHLITPEAINIAKNFLEKIC